MCDFNQDLIFIEEDLEIKIFLQCFDTVGWVTGGTCAVLKLDCWLKFPLDLGLLFEFFFTILFLCCVLLLR